jgi:hypothetical protein
VREPISQKYPSQKELAKRLKVKAPSSNPSIAKPLKNIESRGTNPILLPAQHCCHKLSLPENKQK